MTIMTRRLWRLFGGLVPFLAQSVLFVWTPAWYEPFMWPVFFLGCLSALVWANTPTKDHPL